MTTTRTSLSVCLSCSEELCSALNGTVPAGVAAVRQRADRADSVGVVADMIAVCVRARGEEVSSLMTVVMPNRKRLVHSSNENLVRHPRVQHSWEM